MLVFDDEYKIIKSVGCLFLNERNMKEQEKEYIKI